MAGRTAVALPSPLNRSPPHAFRERDQRGDEGGPGRGRFDPGFRERCFFSCYCALPAALLTEASPARTSLRVFCVEKTCSNFVGIRSIELGIQ